MAAGAARGLSRGASRAMAETRGVELVVTFGPGSAADVIARTLARAAERHLGEPIRVVQKTADAGAEGYRYVKAAPADGRTLIWNATALLTMIHQGKLDFDHRAFGAVARITVDSLSLIVGPRAPWPDLAAFVAHARQHRGLAVGHEGPGTFAHLVAAALEHAAGLAFTHVESGPGPDSVRALADGRIAASTQAVAGIAAAARDGTIRLLGVSGEGRSPAFPDVPTFTEQGVPVAMDIWRGLAVPSATPRETIARLGAAFEQATGDPSFREASRTYGFAIRYLPGAEFDRFIAAEDARLRGVMERLGLRRR